MIVVFWSGSVCCGFVERCGSGLDMVNYYFEVIV